MMRRTRHGPRRNHHRQAMPHSMACHYSAVLQPSAIHRRTRLPQCFRPQSARVEWTLLDVSPRSTFPISRAMADRMTAQRQNRADFWPATIHTAMSRQRRPPLPASAMPSSSHMLLPHQPANPIPADGITAAGEAEAHPSFHVFHKESQGMGSHAFPQHHRQQRQCHQQLHRGLRHGKSVGTQVVEQPSPLQRRRDGLQASAHLAAQLQIQRAGRMKFHTKLIHMLVLFLKRAAASYGHVNTETGQFRHCERSAL